MELTIEGLSKTYPNGVQALQNVSLAIPAGMFGLLGPNGAGKSTLMRTIATLQEADSGSIRLNDLDVLVEKARVREILGYLPQEFGLYPKVRARDMLAHFAFLKGIINKRERQALVDRILQITNLYDVRKKQLGSFSGGMKQRFGIAQALIGDPKLIIVDEPTAGLDPEERVRFHNLLSEIGENIIVILSTHIVSDVNVLCSHMAIINKGEVLATGVPIEMVQSLAGKIWKKFVEKTELGRYTAEFNVISTKLLSGRTLIHVYSDTNPGDNFEPETPELEDVYFATIKGCFSQNHNLVNQDLAEHRESGSDQAGDEA
ncbi:ABC transporter ATP-binding protein [candidate division CSSED10-310 bacterium]|uniref:ABC transporter ATP-binding protein n=1 Tax=candidate division CSSED10-310 bacterium TaxID=2855610 RepID=A0ABV6YRP0_UNCC1